MATGSGASLKAAAEVIAKTMRAIAGRFSTEIPPAIKTYLGPGSDTCFIAAGSPGGQWGWTPIHAWMFDEPHAESIPKHPLFGNRKHWYFQPYRPFMEEAAEASAQDAAEVYGDLEIARLARLYGYNEAG